ncbi:MAG: VPLPA-CTERM sorting domain-containing protein [Pseudomonadota bacterium]
MTQRMKIAAAGLTASTFLAAGPASATFVEASLAEIGDDLVFEFEGTVDTTGLGLFGGFLPRPNEIAPSDPYITSLPGNFSFYEEFDGVFPSFGPGGLVAYPQPLQSLATGDAFGFLGDGSLGQIYVPVGYASGEPLSGSATFFDLTLADIGAEEGVYVGSIGATTIEFTVGGDGLGGTSEVPLPAAAWLMLSALGALAAIRRRA